MRRFLNGTRIAVVLAMTTKPASSIESDKSSQTGVGYLTRVMLDNGIDFETIAEYLKGTRAYNAGLQNVKEENS